MRTTVFFLLMALGLSACEDGRIYEKYADFEERIWPVTETPEFEFEITNHQVNYNLYCNVRSSVSFPYSRLFVNYYLLDSSGTQLQKKLIHEFLFDQHNGKPQGTSGLGDIYDQQIPMVKNFHFNAPGKYKVRFEQFMRTDSLQGVLAVGLRVEKTSAE